MYVESGSDHTKLRTEKFEAPPLELLKWTMGDPCGRSTEKESKDAQEEIKDKDM